MIWYSWYIFFVKVNIQMPTMGGRQYPLSTINSCFWTNRFLMKWKIAFSYQGLNPRPFDYKPESQSYRNDTFQFKVRDTGSGKFYKCYIPNDMI